MSAAALRIIDGSYAAFDDGTTVYALPLVLTGAGGDEWDLNPGDTFTVPVSFPGAVLGDLVTVGFDEDLQGGTGTACVSAADMVSVTIFNGTSGSIAITANVSLFIGRFP